MLSLKYHSADCCRKISACHKRRLSFALLCEGMSVEDAIFRFLSACRMVQETISRRHYPQEMYPSPCPVVSFDRQHLVPQRQNLKLDHPLVLCRVIMPTRQLEHGKHFPMCTFPRCSPSSDRWRCGHVSCFVWEHQPVLTKAPFSPLSHGPYYFQVQR